MGWFKRNKESEYLKRQTYIMSNLALFYLIIIALFAVPLLGTFVVVLIKGVIDLRFILLPLAMLIICLILFLAGRGLWRLIRRIRKDGGSAVEAARKQSQEGQAVQISVFNGLFSLTFGHPQNPPALPHESAPKSLPSPSEQDSEDKRDVVCRLNELVALRKAGEIDDQEFEILKAQLIDNSRRINAQQQEP